MWDSISQWNSFGFEPLNPSYSLLPNQSNDLPKFKSNLGPDDPPARRTPRPPEDLRPDFGSGLVRTSEIFPQSLSLSVSEPWATPNRATPKSCYPFKKINNSKKKSQKFKNRPSKQSIQQFNKKLETLKINTNHPKYKEMVFGVKWTYLKRNWSIWN